MRENEGWTRFDEMRPVSGMPGLYQGRVQKWQFGGDPQRAEMRFFIMCGENGREFRVSESGT
jgi:hypothetical protein